MNTETTTVVVSTFILALYLGVWSGIGIAKEDGWFALQLLFIFGMPAILGIIIGYNYQKEMNK